MIFSDLILSRKDILLIKVMITEKILVEKKRVQQNTEKILKVSLIC